MAMVANFHRYSCKFQRDGLFHALHTCRCLGEWPQYSPSKKTPENITCFLPTCRHEVWHFSFICRLWVVHWKSLFSLLGWTIKLAAFVLYRYRYKFSFLVNPDSSRQESEEWEVNNNERVNRPLPILLEWASLKKWGRDLGEQFTVFCLSEPWLDAFFWRNAGKVYYQ